MRKFRHSTNITCIIHHLLFIFETKLQRTTFHCAAATTATACGSFDGEVGDYGGSDVCVGVEDLMISSLGLNFGSICRRRVSLCIFK